MLTEDLYITGSSSLIFPTHSILMAITQLSPDNVLSSAICFSH